jgi:hypothetical protein
MKSTEQGLLTKRFSQVGNRPCFYSLFWPLQVIAGRHENYGDICPGGSKAVIKVKTRHPREADVQDETDCALHRTGLKELFGGLEGDGLIPGGPEQPCQRPPYRLFVIHNEHSQGLFIHGALTSTG